MEKYFIYKIKNIVTGQSYIGSTVNLKQRKQVHLSMLRNNKHHCKNLQEDFNNYKEENYKFIKIEECDFNEALEKEVYYIELYKKLNMGYVQKTNRNKGKDSIITRKRKSIAMLGNKNGLGRVVSEEAKEVARQLNLGKKMSEASKEKMRKAKLGKESLKKIEVVQIDLKTGKPLKVFKSATDAAKHLKISRPNIVKVLKNERSHSGGFGWKYRANVVLKSDELLENPEMDNQQPS